MAVDELLFRRVATVPEPPTTYLRFYQWEQPTLSVGFSQDTKRVVNWDFCKQNQIQVVKRLSGGKAVLHDQELTYCVASNDASCFPMTDLLAAYNRIARALASGFEKLGLKIQIAAPPAKSRGCLSSACFSVANHHELLWRGRKLVGSAQRRTQGAFLQHGSILFEFDSEKLRGCLGLVDEAMKKNHVADLKSTLGHMPETSTITRALCFGFETVFKIRLQEMTGGLESDPDVLRLAKEKYSDLDWMTPELNRD